MHADMCVLRVVCCVCVCVMCVCVCVGCMPCVVYRCPPRSRLCALYMINPVQNDRGSYVLVIGNNFWQLIRAMNSDGNYNTIQYCTVMKSAMQEMARQSKACGYCNVVLGTIHAITVLYCSSIGIRV